MSESAQTTSAAQATWWERYMVAAAQIEAKRANKVETR